jgi:hypothetical protein
MDITLASALLRRKELQQKVDQLKVIDLKALFEVKGKRVKVTDEIDDLVLTVPKLFPEEVTAAYDWHARRLREIDLVIQQANHSTRVEINANVMEDFKSAERPSKASA